MDIKEKKTPNPPKKPVLFYYLIVLVVLAVINFLVMPAISQKSVSETTYDEFLADLNAGKISEVSLEEDTIYYLEETDGRQQVYKTGRIPDGNEVERLDEAGVVFSETMPKEMNPLLSSIISFVLPLILLWVVGGWLMKWKYIR